MNQHPPVISTEGLTRTFGPVTAIDNLNLDLPAGAVIGLVGPNGSGKSTLIRMLLGLIKPTGGTAIVLGHPITHPSRYATRVGALIENPAFVPTLTARANLTSLAQLRRLPATRVNEVLDAVGLGGRDREPVKRFSLGMKQRLGIAAALLPEPELLVLDEPTNGLDPAGIVEIRQLIRQLGESGRTVIVSSHLLAEIHAACDHLTIIRFGELLFNGHITTLISHQAATIEIAPQHASDLPALTALLGGAGWTCRPTDDGNTAIDAAVVVDAAAENAAAINRLAASAGITLRLLSPRTSTLEEIFLTMTGTTDGELAQRRAEQTHRHADPAASTHGVSSGAFR